MASYLLRQGYPVYFPVAQANWVDLAYQTPHGFKRVQVKTSASTEGGVRVRSLGSDAGLEPEDRYDVLAVAALGHLWLIPSTAIAGRDTITLQPNTNTCPYAGYKEE